MVAAAAMNINWTEGVVWGVSVTQNTEDEQLKVFGIKYDVIKLVGATLPAPLMQTDEFCNIL